jgi:hypothetical protein
MWFEETKEEVIEFRTEIAYARLEILSRAQSWLTVPR